MNTSDNNIEMQVRLCALIGPIIAVATGATLLFKGSQANLYLSWTLLLGILLSWKWKIRGLVGALAGLTLLVGYHYLDIPADERIWHLGMSFAIALTFVVTALSFDEIESLVEGMKQESSSRLKSLLQLDEKLETVQGRLEKETSLLKEQLSEAEEKCASYERLIEVTREEILSTHAEQEKLLKELFEKRHEVNKLKEGLPRPENESEAEVAELRAKVTELQECADPKDRKYLAMYKQLRTQFEEKSHLLDQTRKELFQAKERAMCVEREWEQHQLGRSERERELELCVAELEEEHERLLSETIELENLVEKLSLEPATV